MIDDLRDLLAEVTGRPALRRLPADRPLLRDGAGLDSVTGVQLLAAVRERYGVDVAAEDLGLSSLDSLASLARFLSGHGPAPAAAAGPTALTPKTLHLLDGRADGSGLLADPAGLIREMRAAVAGAGGHVLGERHVVFPNGAITVVMVLAESHLCIHTWPEEQLVACDLFSCGAIDGGAVLTRLAGLLGLTETRHTCIPRGDLPSR
ncbi:S-adenosylmethionine decarboxylase [Natronosporangium hydrolyticum]|uniref:S-adenosylmethionine decarboxylase n=1 Tax=Natronosporangium hydrolyticum TaxID=2811111 RepID=A0A895YBY5_9ACTN|nr:S-adenosylmethionine decarboxylase [Natronosporangium hydrolyticum]QSB13732.1 S-adenosylmethionine decarboxylase [Natronosporangium hydrolyticum]